MSLSSELQMADSTYTFPSPWNVTAPPTVYIELNVFDRLWASSFMAYRNVSELFGIVVHTSGTGHSVA